MVIPLLAALDPRKTVTGTPFENVAEEVLNGLFCHYEPPVSEYTQHKAAKAVRKNPKKYSFSEVKKTESILRTSRLFRKREAFRSATTEPAVPFKKAVTWRDEKSSQSKGIEGRIEGCATRHCDFLGFSTMGGVDLADNEGQTAQTHTPKMPGEVPVPPPIIKQTPTVREPLKDGSSKKILYDDEGHPIGNVAVDPTDEAPPAPSGLSQLRQMARELDNEEDMYEPENYDQPSRRRLMPPRSATPRHERPEDPIGLQRSESPAVQPHHYDTREQFEVQPNHYDTPEQFEGSDRPATPYRRREAEVVSYPTGENSIVDRDSRQFPISPSKRSEVHSELTMDPALREHNKGAPRPAQTSKQVEDDMPSSAQLKVPDQDIAPTSEVTAIADVAKVVEAPSQDTSVDQRKNLLTEVRGRRGTILYDEMGNIVERRADLESKDVVKGKSSSLATRKSELPFKSNTESDGFQKLQKLPRTKVPPLEDETTTRKPDPTPRMSMEPLTADKIEPVSADSTTPLPPTPRRKSDARRSTQNTRFDREERKREEAIRARLSQAYLNDFEKKIDSGKKKATSASKKQSMSPKTFATDDEIRAEVTTIGDTEYHNPYSAFEYLEDEPFSKEQTETRQVLEPISENLSSNNASTMASIEVRDQVLKKTTSDETAQKSKQSSTSGNSKRSDKIWKGWKKTIGTVKKFVNDIDEQRIPTSVPTKSRR